MGKNDKDHPDNCIWLSKEDYDADTSWYKEREKEFIKHWFTPVFKKADRIMENIEEFLVELGFIKTGKPGYDKLQKVYEKQVFLDSPYNLGGRFNRIVIKLRDDREAIQIIAYESGFFDDNILYEGYCKSVEYLRLLLQNLFGGDGNTQEWINKQFNDRLFKKDN